MAKIETFEIFKKKWFRKFLELPNGISSDDTIRVIISNINSNYFYDLIIDFFIKIIINLIEIVNEKNDSKKQDILSNELFQQDKCQWTIETFFHQNKMDLNIDKYQIRSSTSL